MTEDLERAAELLARTREILHALEAEVVRVATETEEVRARLTAWEERLRELLPADEDALVAVHAVDEKA